MSEERLFAVRGAVQAGANEADAIVDATEELMRELLERNELGAEAMVSCLFTTTEDLDADSTGLLLLTNDGELANRLTHPRYEVAKAYRVELGRPPKDADLRRLAAGVELEDGMTAPAEVERIGGRVVEIILREGRNRQVRRMVEAIGNEVTALRRIRFGPVGLGSLAEGKARLLSRDEVETLREAGLKK